ncbi:hypothetical protein [Vibrio mediterranei]|uniref:hypothetical protein n=1 Tax=Vibrio mediterranei TaxID=689 RepID=UPI00148B705F|nr:hypothetical protein [Vibrio mediterranei]NOH31585.1 hypothetical protein [Vibrio mediterranei]
MKKSIALSLLFLAGSAHANNLDILNQDMMQLGSIDSDTAMYVVTDSNSYSDVTSAVAKTKITASKLYVDEFKAKDLKLNQVKHFYVYTFRNIDTLIDNIAMRVEADSPEFFSVRLFKGLPVSENNTDEFVARVRYYVD